MAKKKSFPQTEEVMAFEISKVSDETLIASILKGTTGKRSSISVARDLLAIVDGDLLRLSNAVHVHSVEGYSMDGHARLLAALEISRRSIHRSVVRQRAPLTTSRAVFDYAASLALGTEESLVAIFVDRRLYPIATRVLTKGSSEFTVVDPKQILRLALGFGAHAFVMIHNHPSGDLSPSHQDIDVTKRTASVARAIGVPLLDHVIIVSGGFTSLKERGEIF